jgi:crotonobetainyl-CoA:carnitine CoA-transferase CaiB-like acyl-CoA transferase
LPHPTAGVVPQIVSPLNLTQAPLSFEQAPPLLGASTEKILQEIGVTPEQYAALKARGVI